MRIQKYNLGWLQGLGHMMFPTVCRSCGLPLQEMDDVVCISCLYQLPRTYYHKYAQNPVYQKFWGRIPAVQAFSFLHFQKGNVVQTLLHALKYSNRQDIGERLGYLFGKELTESGFHGPELIVPLPLHPNKLRARGYNQCDPIGRGLAKGTGIPLASDGLVVRVVANPTQTRKSRFDRWTNVERIFEVKQPEKLDGKHILLIDDVVTTGSTLESCGHTLLEAGAGALSIATLASA